MNYAIVLSGGVGTRMREDGFPKQYLIVEGKPILMYTLETVQKAEVIDKIVIVAADEWKEDLKKWIDEYHIEKCFEIAQPGDSRQESILSGLEACERDSKDDADNVIIMDGVRALMTTDLIKRCVAQLTDHEGCMPVVPLNDTIYVSKNGKSIENLLDRSTLWAGQNPEGYNLKRYLEICRDLPKEKLATIRGSSELGYYYDMDIALFPGEDTNFKITTPADLARFQSIVQERKKL